MNSSSFARLFAVAMLAVGVPAAAAPPVSASPGAAPPVSASPGAAGTLSVQRTYLVSAASAASADVAVDGVADSVLSVRGAGPFLIGARLQALQEAGLIDWVAARPGCDIVIAGVTGDWAGVVLLTFRGGWLVVIGTATTPPRSPAGASVGMGWSEIEAIYGNRGRLIYNRDGDRAYVVRFGSRVEFYGGHPIREGVGSFQVGPANFILSDFFRGSEC